MQSFCQAMLQQEPYEEQQAFRDTAKAGDWRRFFVFVSRSVESQTVYFRLFSGRDGGNGGFRHVGCDLVSRELDCGVSGVDSVCGRLCVFDYSSIS